jgi:hypothetical protein
MAKWSVGNHIYYFTEKATECNKLPQQTTLFDVTTPGLLSKEQDTEAV